MSHSAVMERVRARVKDRRVLALVKAFLKAGVLTELGEHRDTLTGTPQGGILSPLIFNMAFSALDEHLTAPWEEGGLCRPSTGARAAAAKGCRPGGSSATRTTITAGGRELQPIAAIPVTRYRYRGSQIPSPWAAESA